ncbi:MAG: Gfo/Idh/MocA family oxidoreductase [Paenibacillaceae bacterium]
MKSLNTLDTNKLRWGILGCAGIAVKSVIPGIQQSQTSTVSAIASRDAGKAEAVAKQLGIAQAYGSYEELLADPNIDVVYIPLPNHLHCEWTIRAAEAGKHVLCEKPIALDAQEAEKMVKACSDAGVLLAEAFMYRHHPRYDRIKEIIRSGEIGAIRGIHGAFTFNEAANSENVRFKRFMGGGSLYDVGCYPISAARYILEREPEAATVHAIFSSEYDHVDMMAAGILEFSGGVALTFDCGMWAAFRNTLEILGTEGIIEVPSGFLSRADSSANFFVQANGVRREEEVTHVNSYSLQTDDFANSVWGNQPLRIQPEDAVYNMRVIDACLKSAMERKRIEIFKGATS